MRTINGTHKGTTYTLIERAEGGVTLTRVSPFTGQPSSKNLETEFERFEEYYCLGTGLIQNIFPDLSADDREFIMTGITPADWDSTFGGED